MIPRVGLGTWKTEPKVVSKAVQTALQVGYRHFDCAHSYDNEEGVGEALKKHLDSDRSRRSDLFITSKLWNTFHRPDLVLQGVNNSLAKLQLNYLDLYLIHWPTAYKPGKEKYPKDKNGIIFDTSVHYLDTWKAMEKLVDRGLVRFIGVSNFNRQQLSEVLSHARIKPFVLQIENHPLLVQDDLVMFAQSKGLTVTAYSPLAQGETELEDRPFNVFKHPTVQGLAKKHGVTPAQVLLRFQLERNITVIPKSVQPERIAENFNVFNFRLSEEDVLALKAMNKGWRSVPKGRDRDHPHFPFKDEKQSS